MVGGSIYNMMSLIIMTKISFQENDFNPINPIFFFYVGRESRKSLRICLIKCCLGRLHEKNSHGNSLKVLSLSLIKQILKDFLEATIKSTGTKKPLID